VKTLANTTVLSNFAAVGRLDLLKQLHGRLHIPNEVWAEILDGLEEGYGFYTGIEDQLYPLAEGGWIELVSMGDEEELRLFQSLPRRLHHGEASCLAIARHRNWAFLSDDKLARKLARSLGIVVSGTLGVLAQAVKRQFLTVEEADRLLGDMIARGYRSPYDSLQQFLDNG
jgi:predicted nucleic acid-binding protein